MFTILVLCILYVYHFPYISFMLKLYSLSLAIYEYKLKYTRIYSRKQHTTTPNPSYHSHSFAPADLAYTSDDDAARHL